MNEIIDELTRNIETIATSVNQDEINLQVLIEKYKSIKPDSINTQKERRILMKNIYDLKRKILKEKMLLLSYQERIEFIKIRGKDVPEEYKIIEFTNDEYKQINTEDINPQTKVTKSNRFFKGLFRKDLFSLQTSNDKKNDELNQKVSSLNSYSLSLKDLFDLLVSNLNDFLTQLNYANLPENQILFAATRYLEKIEFDTEKYNLSKELKRDLSIMKKNYINLLMSELKVYIPDRDKIELSDIKFLSSKTRFINHLNILLNQYMDYQIEKFSLENDQTKYNLQGKENIIDSLSYLEILDTEYTNIKTNNQIVR